MPEATPLRPLVVNALYPAINRGLAADILAARALGDHALPVCAAIVSAGPRIVTDQIEVPSDTVAAQIEHVFHTTQPTGAALGILGGAPTIEEVFRLFKAHLTGPIVLNATLSGPTNEDVAGSAAREALMSHWGEAALVAVRAYDAQLLAHMEITSLDDAQVAAQRLHRRGARAVLLRLGRLGAASQGDGAEPPYMSDLYYDGAEFALFEAPHVAAPGLHGASSLLTLAILHGLTLGIAPTDAIQAAKTSVSEAARRAIFTADTASPDYFWNAASGAPSAR